MKKKIVFIILIAVLLFVIFWLGSLIKCEIVTALHGDEFLGLEQVETSEFKILNYKKDFARIYCVYDDAVANVYTFIKQDGVWVYDEWETTVWSTRGTADGFVWPYIHEGKWH
ncbi:MAG: hypothetical protein IJO50_00800 [Clostridia bacterium]|nr:hypothetical protein [Clostridia bacterium]